MRMIIICNDSAVMRSSDFSEKQKLSNANDNHSHLDTLAGARVPAAGGPCQALNCNNFKARFVPTFRRDEKNPAPRCGAKILCLGF
jgi:hypothetical protein